MQIFKVTIHCDKNNFQIDEIKEVMREFSLMKIKTEGIRIGKIDVEEVVDEKQA